MFPFLSGLTKLLSPSTLGTSVGLVLVWRSAKGTARLRSGLLTAHLNLTLGRNLQRDGVSVELFGQQKVFETLHFLTVQR